MEKRDIESQTTRDVSVAETENILVWSFYHSQGNPLLQEHILTYIAHKHPNWHFCRSAEIDSQRLAAKMRAGARFAQPAHKHRTATYSSESLAANAKMYLTKLTNPEKSVSILKIASEILSTDEQRAAERDVSFFIDYVLTGKKVPGPYVFADIYSNIRRALQNKEVRANFIAETSFYRFEFRDLVVDKMKEVFGDS
jgi:hypothetical protein